jgi:sugar phosphate isomerase/epimerase
MPPQMLRVGLNPYGIAYTIGLHGAGTPRANPRPLDLWGYLDLAERVGATQAIEFPVAWLAPLSFGEMTVVRERVEALGATPVLSQKSPVGGYGVAESIALAPRIGARVVRTALTPVLCGDRAQPKYRWPETVAEVRRALAEAAPRMADAGLSLAIEDHQDFTSGELVELCQTAGPSIGITLDVGNALAVGEDPVAFARTVGPHVRHVHLKDYRAHWTDEGYRLVRCAAGDGAVPFPEVIAALAEHHQTLTASIECGALNARHVRLLLPAWWAGYPERPASALAAGLLAARVRRLDENDEWRTPWEREQDSDAITAYEQEQLRRSVANLRQMGLMS